MKSKELGESSSAIRARVNRVRNIQTDRFSSRPGVLCNGQMGSRDIEEFCQIESSASRLLEKAMEKLGLSARGYHRILKLARTIADMDNAAEIASSHVAEAIQYRRIGF